MPPLTKPQIQDLNDKVSAARTSFDLSEIKARLLIDIADEASGQFVELGNLRTELAGFKTALAASVDALKTGITTAMKANTTPLEDIRTQLTGLGNVPTELGHLKAELGSSSKTLTTQLETAINLNTAQLKHLCGHLETISGCLHAIAERGSEQKPVHVRAPQMSIEWPEKAFQILGEALNASVVECCARIVHCVQQSIQQQTPDTGSVDHPRSVRAPKG